MKRSLLLAGMVALALTACGKKEAPPPPAAAPAAAPAATLELMPVQGNLYMLTGLDVNVAVQIGDEGALLVDTPPPAAVTSPSSFSSWTATPSSA